ncbi:MAG TPA: metallophosphoesterase, partial [Vicinamibacterales bacterium]|nr:metallophosphoesterase [Vicinamibacterales bacterium]
MRFGVLGDIHGDFETARRIMERHGDDVPFWLCVGDLATADGGYEALPSPLHWIKGNNENFDAIAEWDAPGLKGRAYEKWDAPGLKGRAYDNLHYTPNGQRTLIHGLAVAGLGGTYAPTMYDVAAADLPHPTKSSAKA